MFELPPPSLKNVSSSHRYNSYSSSNSSSILGRSFPLLTAVFAIVSVLIIVESHQSATAEDPETAVGIESVKFQLYRDNGPALETIPITPDFDPDIYNYTVRTSKNMTMSLSIKVIRGSEILINRGNSDPLEFPGDLTVTLSPDTDDEKVYTFRLQDKPDKVTHKPNGLAVETTPSGSMWIDWYDPEAGGIPAHYIVSVKPLDGGKSHSQRVKGSRYAIFEDLPAGEYRIWVRGQNRLGKGPKAKINFTHR